MSLQTQVQEAFAAHYGGTAQALVRAPGRVNLIGEHTDYNEGFVLPMAIDRAAWLALTPRDDATVRVHFLDFEQGGAFDLGDLHKGDPLGPLDYVKAVAWALQRQGHRLRGFDAVVAGDVPIGAGLSSSAALELAVARAFAVASDLAWDGVQMARAARHGENGFIGLNVGIMDQMISAMGQAGAALLIDCRAVEQQPLPAAALTLAPAPSQFGCAVVVLDTNTRRSLAVGKAYNERRASCVAAADYFGVSALRDVTPEQVQQAPDLDPLLRKRARHITTENQRAQAAWQALQAGDMARLGQLMNASHASLRDDYEVSNDALDQIVACAQAHPAAYGARMTGAGFGGCAVALVAAAQVARFIHEVAACYAAASGRAGAGYVFEPAAGASVLLGG